MFDIVSLEAGQSSSDVVPGVFHLFIDGSFVSDHKSSQFHQPGEDMVLQLYTRHSVRVVFQAR